MLVGGEARHADGVLDGVGAAVGEEDLAEARAGLLDDALRGLAAHEVGVRGGDRRELGGLALDRLDDLRVRVADVGVDELAREVEVGLAVVGVDLAARGARDDEGLRAPCALHEWKTYSRSSSWARTPSAGSRSGAEVCDRFRVSVIAISP